ncbi:MAG: class I SAM-dependent methyltransferase [Vicinamibacterales bacterium]
MSYAAFMELALYHPDSGYYSAAGRRSGARGDFITSPDLGSLFGEALSLDFVHKWQRMGAPASVDLVEAGAGDGRLARDVLDAAAPFAAFYDSIRLHLVERSPAARTAHKDMLARHEAKLVSSSDRLPERFAGILFANELLDAMPVHVVVMREHGLREVLIDVQRGRLVEIEGEPSTPLILEYLERRGGQLEAGWRTEVNLAALEFLRRVSASLARGFVLLVDYGYESESLSARWHSAGTLRSYTRHVAHMSGEGGAGAPWLFAPGSCDMTSHVDFTALRAAAADLGLRTVQSCDQMHYLLGLGVVERNAGAGRTAGEIARRLALKTLLLPEGFGATHKVLILARDAGATLG